MQVVKAPLSWEVLNDDHTSIFLAGSIEMGAAENWQDRFAKEFDVIGWDDVLLLNPRRDDWDASWEQKITNPQFYEQVSWELNALERCDIIALYFDPNTKSPISLLELGLFAHETIFICCPEGFWRKGNVEIVCDRYDVPLFESEVAWLVAIQRAVRTIEPSRRSY